LCVSENTKVWTIDGYKKIKNIKHGEVIYSYDYENGQLISTKVKDCWESGFKETFNVRTRYNSIDVTDDHQILIYNDGDFEYKTLKEIKIGEDNLVIPSLDNVSFEKIIDITSNEPEPVWDLEVESEHHNFIANGSVVHNCLAEDAMLI
jgi:intein/homing endonuclease